MSICEYRAKTVPNSITNEVWHDFCFSSIYRELLIIFVPERIDTNIKSQIS